MVRKLLSPIASDSLSLFEEDTFQSQHIFTTGDIASSLKVPIDEVDYLIRCGLLKPSVRSGSGCGSRRLFNLSDLRQALLIQRLRNAKWKPKQIFKALSAVSAQLNNPDLLHTPLLIHEGNSLLILCRSKGKEPMLLDAAHQDQYVMVIALDTLDEETRMSLARSK